MIPTRFAWLLILAISFPLPGDAGTKSRSRPFDRSIPLQDASLVVLKLPYVRLLFTPSDGDVMTIQGAITTEEPDLDLTGISLKVSRESEVIRVSPDYPKGKNRRLLKQNAWFEVNVSMPRDRDIRLQLRGGSATIAGPFRGKMIAKMRKGHIRYSMGDPAARDFEGRIYFGKIHSEVPDMLPRPFFPLGKRILVLNPEGVGEVSLRVTWGSLQVDP